MKILQTLEIGKDTLIFTDNPEQDIVKIKEEYENEDREYYMGYETPILTTFNFLGIEYPCISFWHDNEEIREIQLKA